MIFLRWRDRGWKKNIKGSFDVIESPVKDKKQEGKAANLSLEISAEEVEIEKEGGTEEVSSEDDDIEKEGGKQDKSNLQRQGTAFQKNI